jgi:hypothetical protein
MVFRLCSRRKYTLTKQCNLLHLCACTRMRAPLSELTILCETRIGTTWPTLVMQTSEVAVALCRFK